MTRALLKKQLAEVFSWLYKDQKSGKLRNSRQTIAFGLLYLLIFGFLGAIFFKLADTLCKALVSVNMGWLYWCLMGLVSIFLGVFGSVFNTYGSLYQAKDNDFLLAMPIPVSRILLARLSGVYFMGLMYELIVMLPTLAVWFLTAPFSVEGTIFVLLIPLLLSVLILSLSVILGWAVAAIVVRLKHKNILTVFLSIVFIACYYFFYSKAYSMLQTILLHAENVGNKIKKPLFLLYNMGLAAEGHAAPMLIFAAATAIIFIIIYTVLSYSFLKLATTVKGYGKAVYTEQKSKSHSVDSALLLKELRRFLGSSNYMLNCGLGIIFMPIAAVLLIWRANTIQDLAVKFFTQDVIPLIATAAICITCGMNDITAPSISLEGKNIWLVQSFPISCSRILKAKLRLHLILTLAPAIPLIIAVEFVIKPSIFYVLIIPIVVVLFVLLTAGLGLAINLKMPNLNWSNEIVPIKQSLGVMICLFGGWVIIAILVGLYILLQSYISPILYILCICVFLLGADISVMYWILTKGTKIFENL